MIKKIILKALKVRKIHKERKLALFLKKSDILASNAHFPSVELDIYCRLMVNVPSVELDIYRPVIITVNSMEQGIYWPVMVNIPSIELDIY